MQWFEDNVSSTFIEYVCINDEEKSSVTLNMNQMQTYILTVTKSNISVQFKNS